MSLTSGGFNIPQGVFNDAVRYFWEQRRRQASDSRGGEGQARNVRGGRHLDGVQAAIVELLTKHGVAADDIFSNCALHKTGKLELPGFFRPTKQWDLLVIRDGRLLAAMELKAQAGSFGNNFNNRTEEAMGSSLDIWTAYREGAFLHSPPSWLGYLFLLEEHPQSTAPVRNPQPHFKVFDEFEGASYARRYELFCGKLVFERRYSSACFLMSRRPQLEIVSGDEVSLEESCDQPAFGTTGNNDASHPIYSEPSDDLDARQFLTSLLRAVVPV